MPTATRSALAWLPGFVLLSAFWGSSFALIKIALEAGVAPPWVAFARCAVGAVTLVAICVLTRTPLPRDRSTWGHAAVVAVLANTAPFVLLAYGEQHVDSVLAGLLNATTPLMTLLFVPLLVPTERITARRVAGPADRVRGRAVCPRGVARRRRRNHHGDPRLSRVDRLLRRHVRLHAALLRRPQRLRGGAVGGPAPLRERRARRRRPRPRGTAGLARRPAAVALLALGALGTGWAYVLNLGVVRAAGPTVASTVTYVIPVWSTLIGAVLLAEPVGWNTVAGGVLVVAGVVVTRLPERA